MDDTQKNIICNFLFLRDIFECFLTERQANVLRQETWIAFLVNRCSSGWCRAPGIRHFSCMLNGHSIVHYVSRRQCWYNQWQAWRVAQLLLFVWLLNVLQSMAFCWWRGVAWLADKKAARNATWCSRSHSTPAAHFDQIMTANDAWFWIRCNDSVHSYNIQRHIWQRKPTLTHFMYLTSESEKVPSCQTSDNGAKKETSGKMSGK